MFTSEKINDHLYRIQDVFGVCMYLLTDCEKSFLIDTGYGRKGLRQYIETLTDRPLSVLITHGHIDHVGGAYEFADRPVYMSHEDLGVYKRHTSAEFREYFFAHSYLQTDGIDFMEKNPVGFLEVCDGDEYCGGKLHIRAFHVPGHTRGTMMYLLAEDRIMIFGDACGPNTLLMEDFSSNVSDYLEALRGIKKNEHLYDSILRFHGTCVSDKALLDNVIEVAEKIVKKEDAHQLLPALMQNMLPSELESAPLCYSGRSQVLQGRSLVNEDGKEGNINYRDDKRK